MSSTALTATPTTATAPSATASGCGALLYDIPTQDASCALPYGSNHTDIMSACCQSADVVAYQDNCGLYCLAEGQSVSDLASCFQERGALPQDVFCRGVGNATATGSGDAPLASGASVVSASASASATAGRNSSSESGSTNGAAGKGGLGVGGLAVTVLVFSSVMFGALQV